MDVKDYSAGWYRWSGYVLVAAVILFILFFNPLILLFGGGWNRFCMFNFVFLIGLLAILFIAKTNGMIFNIPLKVYDKGIHIQSISWDFKGRFIPFEDIRSLEFFFDCGWSYANRGCAVKTISRGTITSIENFPSVERLEEFIEKIKPILEKKGLRLVKKEEHKRRYRLFRFER